MIAVRNVHDPVLDHDGFRVLIEPIWPENLSRTGAVTDLWARDLAPDPELYAMFLQDRISWEDFLPRYYRELEECQGSIADLLAYASNGGLTVLHESPDAEHNIATALKAYLDRKRGYPPAPAVR